MDEKEDDDDHFAFIQSVSLSKQETKQVGCGCLSGLVGVIILCILPFAISKNVAYGILFLFVIAGYLVGIKQFPKAKKGRSIF